MGNLVRAPHRRCPSSEPHVRLSVANFANPAILAISGMPPSIPFHFHRCISDFIQPPSGWQIPFTVPFFVSPHLPSCCRSKTRSSPDRPSAPPSSLSSPSSSSATASTALRARGSSSASSPCWAPSGLLRASLRGCGPASSGSTSSQPHGSFFSDTIAHARFILRSVADFGVLKPNVIVWLGFQTATDLLITCPSP